MDRINLILTASLLLLSRQVNASLIVNGGFEESLVADLLQNYEQGDRYSTANLNLENLLN